MKLDKKYDLIFCGGGLSALITLDKIISDNFFDNKSILVIEKNLDIIPNKTWSFWEPVNSKWNDFVTKSWDKILFKSANIELEKKLKDFNYKMIKSELFYKHVMAKLKSFSNIEFINENVTEVNDLVDHVIVKTDSGEFYGKKVFNSVPNESYKSNQKFPVLLQHFEGWTIKTEKSVFNSQTATLMDFSIDQKNETRFCYVLPTNNNEALIEFTLFSKDLLKDSEYEIEINKYIENLGIGNFQIISKEKGIIPMTCFPFEKENTSNIVNIGTAGGWTKPSTGYTFRFIDKFSDRTIEFLKLDKSFKKFKIKNRFWFYDLIFIDVLYYNNSLGSKIFQRMFEKNKFKSIFQFLDNESRLNQELKIIFSMPNKLAFIKSFFRNISKII